MKICVLNENNIIVNILEAPYPFEDNHRVWHKENRLNELYSDIEPQPTQEEIIKMYTDLVQKHLDDTAKTRGYDGIVSLCTYATSTNPKFKQEGQAGVEWRDAVWAKCYSILADVKAEIRTAPTDLISELPPFTWGD